MKKMYFLSRITALLCMVALSVPMFAGAPDLTPNRKTADFTEETVIIHDTILMGDQFYFYDRYSELPYTFHCDGVPFGAEGNVIISFDSYPKNPEWKEDMQCYEAMMSNCYCYYGGDAWRMAQDAPLEAEMTLYHVDTIQDEQMGTMYTKMTTYEMHFYMQHVLTQPGLSGDTDPNPDAVRDLIIAVNEDIDNPYTYFEVQTADYDEQNGLTVQWNEGASVTLTSSNPEVVYVQPTRQLSGFMEGEAIITMTLAEDTYGHTYKADSVQFKVTVKSFVETGRCGEKEGDDGYYVMWGLSANNTLSIWLDPAIPAEQLYSRSAVMPDYNYDRSNSPDGSGITESPWYSHTSEIQYLNLEGLQNIGNNAFYGMTNLRFVRIPKSIHSTGYMPFMGCTNLTTIEFENSTQMDINSDVLTLAMNEDYEVLDNIHIIVVPDSAALEMYEEMLGGVEFPKPLVFKVKGADNGMTVEVEKDEESGEMKMTISQTTDDGTPFVLPDRQAGEVLPFDELADQVIDLELVGVNAVGSGVFENMSHLKTIKFTQHGSSSLEQIHLDAFSRAITPWMFSMGDPQDGPLVPPTIVLPEGMSENDAIMRWRELFAANTMLYVPDEQFERYGREVSAFQLYKEDWFWSNVFDYMTDRTVGVTNFTESIELSWYPLENAKGYRLTIHKEGCDDCDTTIILPAKGRQGILDWEKINPDELIPGSGAPRRRAPKSDDGSGGMTITLQMGSGGTHTSAVSMSVSNVAAGATYTYTREVLKEDDEVDVMLTKTGSFVLEDSGAGIEDVEMKKEIDIHDAQTKIYDVLGHPVRMAVELLPSGVYILENGGQRATILLSR